MTATLRKSWICFYPRSQVDFEARQRAELIPTIPQAEVGVSWNLFLFFMTCSLHQIGTPTELIQK